MSIYASRYARAFADVVESAGLDPASIDQQLEDFSGTWNGSAELREILNNPAVSNVDKVAILDKINGRMGCVPLVRNFLAVLINHGRLEVFDEVLTQYRREMHQRMGISEAEVTTARKLDEDERRDLEVQVGKLAGTRIAATFGEDRSLLGGVVVRIGSTVYDGSVRGNLNKLKAQLIAG